MTLLANLKREPVRNLSLRPAVTVPALSSVRHAVQTMREHQIGCVFVVDAAGHPLGIFHERILLTLLDENPAGIDDNVARHIDKRCACVQEDEPIASAVYVIESRDQRFVGVVNQDRQLLALTGEKGLMEYVADHFPRQVMVATPGVRHQDTNREGA